MLPGVRRTGWFGLSFKSAVELGKSAHLWMCWDHALGVICLSFGRPLKDVTYLGRKVAVS